MVEVRVVDRALPTTGPGPVERTGAPPDVAVNLHGRGPQSHRALLALRPRVLVAFASAQAGVCCPPSRADEHEVDRWVRLVRSTGAECDLDDLRLPYEPEPRGRTVVLHPGAASGSRRWPVDRWKAVGTPSVLLFGPVSPAQGGPPVDRGLHRVLWHPDGAQGPGDPHGAALDPRLAGTDRGRR